MANFLLNILSLGYLNRKEQEIRKQEEMIKKREEYLTNRRKEYNNTYNSINFLEPKVYENKTKRYFLKDFPYDTKIKNVTKTTKEYDLHNFIVIDVETTGLKPATNEIIEISMIKFIDGNPVDCLKTLVKPKKDIPQNIISINHIDNEMVKNCPNIEFIIEDFNNFIKGFNIVGYNLIFDLEFLHCNGLNFFSEKRKFYDCLLLCRKYFKGCTDDFKLDTITKLCNIYRNENHRATDDALATGLIFRDIGKKIINNN